MAGTTKFENDVLAALNAIRDRMPVWTETIQLGVAGAVVDFGTGAALTRTIEAPVGFKGKVMGVALTRNAETFTAGAEINVGTASDEDAYYAGGAIATGTASQHPAGTHREYIPGGEDFVVTLNPTGGTPTGQAAASITINWYEE